MFNKNECRAALVAIMKKVPLTKSEVAREMGVAWNTVDGIVDEYAVQEWKPKTIHKVKAFINKYKDKS